MIFSQLPVPSYPKLSKSVALRHLKANGAIGLFGTDVEVELNNAKSMEVWPLSYLTLNTILTAFFSAVCTLFFYRIRLFVAGVVIAALSRQTLTSERHMI